MGMSWTEDQQKVISLRDRNILVSAAAGSGKTAVLVQRILEMIMDQKRPVGIDELLIMTFTRAAAGEMKERISKALEKAVSENPDNEHLQRQLTILPAAQITTIDGFCGYVIRNYFHRIDLDPGYRVGDEGELSLLRQDVLTELLESCYAEASHEFTFFLECFTPGKTDESIKEDILKIYQAAMSNPFPEEWLEQCLNMHRIPYDHKLKDQAWMNTIWTQSGNRIRDAKKSLEQAMELCGCNGGPYYYEDALLDDLVNLKKIEALWTAKDYDGMVDFLSVQNSKRLSNKKDPSVEEVLKNRVKDLRQECKDLLKSLKSDYFSVTEENVLADIHQSRVALEVLVDLTKRFMVLFAEKKREKNLIDFTDMEHFALQILLEKRDGEWVQTQAAKELASRFREVMVDEYQDSNLVQEYLTKAVSGHGEGRKNIFMVGDVKQSIYRFRQARPDLFMEKYETYEVTDSECQRIDLHKNFRSRSEVLHGVNYLFRQIMDKDLGGVFYDDAAALHPGAVFPEGQKEEFAHTEIMVIEKDSEELSEENGVKNAIDLEGLAIAQRIQELMSTEQIYDGRLESYRPLQYGDIVVLLRAVDKWADRFAQIFASKGIPSYTASKSGYFSATEIVTVLNYLRICDNPYQDIPLFGVLRSPIVGLSSEEVAMIRVEYKEMSLYESICSWADDGQLELWEEPAKEVCKQKIRRFLRLLSKMRACACYTPVHQLIIQILDETGYGNYAKAMPAGEQRNANLIMLVEKAMEYEKTSYRGLFNFVRYIEQLQKYEVDYGEVNLSAEENGAVQIMTIHKSKGLEFPIVFAAGMGKGINQMDSNAKVLVHPEFGIASNAIYPDKRVELPTMLKKIIQNKMRTDTLGEELRVLYVALTRAKEKLIITGTLGKVEKKLETLVKLRKEKEEMLPYQVRQSARTFWDYILTALSRNSAMDDWFSQFGLYEPAVAIPSDEGAHFKIRFITAEKLIMGETEATVDRMLLKESLISRDPDSIYDEKIRAQIRERFGYVYPYEAQRIIPSKASISELKKHKFEDDEFDFENPYTKINDQDDTKDSNIEEADQDDAEDNNIEEVIPAFIKEIQKEIRGAARGTAYHRVMECLDYQKVDNDEMICEQISEMIQANKLSQEEAEVVKVKDLRTFLDSSIGERMKKAALAGLLRREQPFVFSVPANRLNKKWDPETSVLIQGIIDAYLIEDGKLVIVDYKTDHIFTKKKLVDRYHIQLEGYADALERLTGLPVSQKIIYSFTMNKEIEL